MTMSQKLARQRQVTIGSNNLDGILSLPPQPKGLVIFAHGSGSSRHSPRNTQVAIRLQEVGLATLLFDLLSEAEASDRAQVFNIPLLAERLEEALDWALTDDDAKAL
ncbi:MAG: erythromycin esterase, partial [bacterium]